MSETARGAAAPRAGRGGLGELRLELRGALAAVTFLTRVPAGRGRSLDGADVARAALAFPLVGGAVGAAVGGCAQALTGALPATLAAALAVALGTLLTGALHLDGLADTADALGGRGRGRALEIMRDHSIGAFGAAALALDLLIRTAALASLARDGRALALGAAAGALSRWTPAALAAALPYVRSGAGTAAAFAGTRHGRAFAAGVLALALAIGTAGVDGLALAAIVAPLTLFAGVSLRAWLGGVTGDALGAALELCETAALVLASALAGGAA
jgi:adenosylcobinamide-GDP ribazoletransferase